MKFSKDVRLLSSALTFCIVILAASLLQHKKSEIKRRNLEEAEKYITEVRVGTSFQSIEIWLKQRDFVCEREENSASNPFAYSIFVDAKVSPRNITFYLRGWDKSEPHTFDHPRHWFVFFFNRNRKLVQAAMLRTYARGVSF